MLKRVTETEFAAVVAGCECQISGVCIAFHSFFRDGVLVARSMHHNGQTVYEIR